MYERFTDRARCVVRLARKRAGEPIRIPALLLGLLDEGSGVAVHVLTKTNVNLLELRHKLQEILDAGSDARAKDTATRPDFHRVVEYAIQEARQLNHNYVGTEHLLLGVLNLHDHVVVRLLDEIGIVHSGVIEELHRLLRTPQPPSNHGPSAMYQFGREVRKLTGRIADWFRSAINRLASASRGAVARLLAGRGLCLLTTLLGRSGRVALPPATTH